MISSHPLKPRAVNRALSKLGILSRTQATDAIRAGRVRVDGRASSIPHGWSSLSAHASPSMARYARAPAGGRFSFTNRAAW
ncbi:MAG: hypothetical protein AUJ01_13380 [Acidobacteria bacterium 13_1_40CM_3_65_5]|nr:MAG: hypothetical protein AUJ01_13380 [Acidobacteria bacterium 13_1_40CM_3_65_5]